MRKELPAGLVSAVIAISFLAPAGPIAALFASAGYGYGYTVSGGGVLIGGPDAGVPSAASEDIFVRGTDNAVYRNHWDGLGFSGWTRGGGVLTADPGAVGISGTTSQVFVRGTTNNLYQNTWNGSTFSGWTNLGGILPQSGTPVLGRSTGRYAMTWPGASCRRGCRSWRRRRIVDGSSSNADRSKPEPLAPTLRTSLHTKGQPQRAAAG